MDENLKTIALDCCEANLSFWGELHKELGEMKDLDEIDVDIRIREYFEMHTGALSKLSAMKMLMRHIDGHL